MGLLNTLGNYANDQKEKLNAYRERYDRYDDERLKREFKKASGIKALAIGSLSWVYTASATKKEVQT